MEGSSTEDVIRTRAYLIWEREGRPSGREYEHWVQAQIELEAERPKGNGGKRVVASPPAPARKEKPAPAGKPAPPRNARVKRSS